MLRIERVKHYIWCIGHCPLYEYLLVDVMHVLLLIILPHPQFLATVLAFESI